MIDQLKFYTKHSFNDLVVNGQRTFFALLCIAAGVAAIVSLQTLAGMIGGTLTENLQRNNRGDIQLAVGGDFSDVSEDQEVTLEEGVEQGILVSETESVFGQTSETFYVSAEGIETIRAWAQENYPDQVDITYRQELAGFTSIFFGNGPGVTVTDPDSGDTAAQIAPVMVQSEIYPFYRDIETNDGTPLSEALASPTDIVVSEKIADTLDLATGDTVQLSGSAQTFTVGGVVPTSVEVTNPIEGFINSQNGFYYIDVGALQFFEDVNQKINTVFIRIDEATPESVNEISAALTERFPYFEPTTTEDLRESYESIAGNIDDLVTVMGLVSMLIGSIGIINTMQVIVRRRTTEIAVLKTIGLQANQVTNLFLVEAIIMGIIGSLIGVALGWGTTFVIRGAAESVFTTELTFRIVPSAVINGIVVGIVVTTIFGFLPTLTAGQVRPGIVLRPSDNMVPRAGILRTIGALLVIVIALTVLAFTILGDLFTAIAVVMGAFVAVAILYGLLNLLVWLFGRLFPTFGNVDLKISLRQMLAGRRRASVTLLALVIGVFSLSLITLFAQSINNLLDIALENAAGGNVAINVQPNQLERTIEVVESQETVNSYRAVESYNVELVSITEDGETVSLGQIEQRLNEAQLFFGDGGGNTAEGEETDEEDDFDRLDSLQGVLGSIDARRANDLPTAENITMAEGRMLTPDDFGQQVIVVRSNPFIEGAGIDAGDVLTFEFLQDGEPTGETIEFEVIGVEEQQIVSIGFDASVYAPVDAFPESRTPTNTTVVVDIPEEDVPAMRQELLAAVPSAFVFDTAFITDLLDSLIGTFTAFPTMVAALGLVVGGVVIANSVALTTMERRREIAVMKSVGLQRERVLGMILLENGILGLIGGLLGVGIGLVGLAILISTLSVPSSSIPIGTALLLMGLCVLVALLAAVTTAWSASGEKPLNVLRTE